MAVGDLSADQRRYRDALVAATGLNAQVATAWIGAESGWNVTKTGDHNYLNVGPGRAYSSATSAAAAAAGLINTSDHYAGIRAAIQERDPDRQIVEIVASPWDAGHYGGDGSRLIRVYEQLVEAPGLLDRARDLAWWSLSPAGRWLAERLPGPGAVLDRGREAVEGAADAAGWITNPAGKLLSQLTGEDAITMVMRVALNGVLLGTAAVLIVLGLLRATRTDPADAAAKLGGLIATRGASAFA